MAYTNSKRKTEQSFAIIYGFAGGPLPGRKLSRLLKEANWKPAKQAGEADLIIAHSAGCWLIPASAKPKLVIYVGMPLAQAKPRQTWATANKLAFQKGGIKHSLKIRAQNSYYQVRQPRRNLGIIRRAKTARPVIFPKAQSIFIANHHDPWLKSEVLQTYINNQEWAFISLPGVHDDIWKHPERYAAIINHYARLLG